MTTSPVVTITEELVLELEKLALNATPGPWVVDNSRVEGSINNAARTRHIAMTSLFQSVQGDDEENWANAGLIAAANPAVILALLAERAAMQSQIKAGIITQDNLELHRKDSERLNKLDSLCEAYGFEGIHEGNRWMIDGPFINVRDAIDAIPDDQAMQERQP